MKRIELYRKDKRFIAEMLAKSSSCVCCPMRETCTEFTGSDRRTGVDVYICYRNWRNFYIENSYELESACEVSERLESIVDCERCPIKEECETGNPSECEFEFEQWLNEEVTPAVATCRKIRPVEERENVIHPQHYVILPGVEVKDISDAVLDRCGYDAVAGAYLFNILKYILRADRKNGIEDYKKALVYMGWLIQRLEKAEHVEEDGQNDND